MTGRFRALALLGVLAASGLGAWLRLRTAAAEDIWVDEAYTVALSSLSWARLWLAPTDPTPPLFYTLQSLVAGGSHDPLAVRALALGTGVLAIPAIAELGRRLAGPAAGVIVALLLAVSGTHIEYSQEARSYAPLFLVVLVSASLASAWVTGSPGRRPRWVAWALATTLALGVWLHFTALLWAATLMGALGLAALAAPDRRAALGQWLGAGLWLAVLTAPALWIALRVGGAFRGKLEQPSAVEALVSMGEIAFARPPGPYAGVVALVLGLAALAGIALTARRLSGAVVMGALLAFAVLLWLAGLRMPVWEIRTALLVQIPLLIGLAAMLARLPLPAAVPATGAAAAAMVFSHLAYERAAPRAYDWKGAAEAAAAEAREGDVLLACLQFTYLPLRVYTPDDGRLEAWGFLGDGRLIGFGRPVEEALPWPVYEDPGGAPLLEPAALAGRLGPGGRVIAVDSAHCEGHAGAPYRQTLEAMGGARRPLWQGRKVSVEVIDPPR